METGIRTAEQELAGVWELDPEHTTVEFAVKHMMFTTVRGRFGGATGRLELGEAPRVEVEIPAASVDTSVAQRDEHLRSADFFDVEQHPVIAFRSRSVRGRFAEPGDRFEVVGDLTIRGTTRQVVLEAEYDGRGADLWGGERIGFSAETSIDRTEYGLKWNQALEAGGVLVSNEVKLRFGVQAVLKSDESAA